MVVVINKDKVKKFVYHEAEDIVLGALAGLLFTAGAVFGVRRGRKGKTPRAVIDLAVDAAYHTGWHNGAHSVLTHISETKKLEEK